MRDHGLYPVYTGTLLDGMSLWYNAPIESFHAILKKEEVYAKIYGSFEQAKLSLFRYIEGFYKVPVV